MNIKIVLENCEEIVNKGMSESYEVYILAGGKERVEKNWKKWKQ